MSFLDNVRDWFCNIVHHDDYTEVEVVKDDALERMVRRASGPGASDAEVLRHQKEVEALNPDMDPDMIHPGDKLRLPHHWE